MKGSISSFSRLNFNCKASISQGSISFKPSTTTDLGSGTAAKPSPGIQTSDPGPTLLHLSQPHPTNVLVSAQISPAVVGQVTQVTPSVAPVPPVSTTVLSIPLSLSPAIHCSQTSASAIQISKTLPDSFQISQAQPAASPVPLEPPTSVQIPEVPPTKSIVLPPAAKVPNKDGVFMLTASQLKQLGITVISMSTASDSSVTQSVPCSTISESRAITNVSASSPSTSSQNLINEAFSQATGISASGFDGSPEPVQSSADSSVSAPDQAQSTHSMPTVDTPAELAQAEVNEPVPQDNVQNLSDLLQSESGSPDPVQTETACSPAKQGTLPKSDSVAQPLPVTPTKCSEFPSLTFTPPRMQLASDESPSKGALQLINQLAQLISPTKSPSPKPSSPSASLDTPKKSPYQPILPKLTPSPQKPTVSPSLPKKKKPSHRRQLLQENARKIAPKGLVIKAYTSPVKKAAKKVVQRTLGLKSPIKVGFRPLLPVPRKKQPEAVNVSRPQVEEETKEEEVLSEVGESSQKEEEAEENFEEDIEEEEEEEDEDEEHLMQLMKASTTIKYVQHINEFLVSLCPCGRHQKSHSEIFFAS